MKRKQRRDDTDPPSHYALDYRIVTHRVGGYQTGYSSWDTGLEERGRDFLADLLTIAKELRFHPTALQATDKSEDFIIPLAATAGALQFAYKLENERIFNVEFTGYPNPTTLVLYSFGDPTAT